MNTTDMLLAQADAYECFWNAALGTARESQDSTAHAVAGALAQGYAAIATRLREHASKSLEEERALMLNALPAPCAWVRSSERPPKVGGTYMTGEWTTLDSNEDSVPHFKRTWPDHYCIFIRGEPTWFSLADPKTPIAAPEFWLEGVPGAPTHEPELIKQVRYATRS